MNWSFQYPVPLEGSVVRKHYESVGHQTLLTLWRRRRMIGSMMAVAALGGLAVLATTKKQYSSTALVQIDFSHEQRLSGSAPAASFTLDPASLIETESRFLRTRTVAKQVLERLPAAEGGMASASTEPATPAAQAGLSTEERRIQELMKNLTVKTDSRSYVIDITYTSPDPQQAADIANLFADVYLNDRTEASAETARRASAWYSDQLRETNDALVAAERAVSEYRTAFGILETPAEGTTLQQQAIRDTQTKAGDATLARINKEANLTRDRLSINAGNIPADVAALPDVQRLIDSRDTARRRVAELTSTLGDLHPSVASARQMLQETERQLRDGATKALTTLSAEADNARTVEQQLTANVQEAKTALIDGKSREADLLTLQSQADAIRDRLKALTASFEQARALAELKPVAAQLMAPADVVPIPAGPKASLVLALSMFGALAVGIALSLLLERLDTGLRREEDVHPETDCRCFGLVSAKLRREAVHETAARREAIRGIAAAAGLTAPQVTAKVALITSARPKEGKTAFVDGLAQCLVDLGKNVLVIDTSPRSEADADTTRSIEDMVADSARRHFVEDRTSAFAALVQRQQSPARGAMHALALASDGEEAATLSVLRRRSGLAQGSSIFAHSAMEDLVKDARLHFDVVLIKAPPVAVAADSLLLSQVADTVMFAVRWNSTRKADVTAALKRLRDAGVHVSGIVLTEVNMKQYVTYRSFFGGPPSRKFRKYYAAFD